MGITVIKHPLISHKLALLRDKSTTPGEFRCLVRQLTALMAYEITRDLPVEKRTIETPLETMEAEVLAPHSFSIVPILRAGLGMVEGFLEFLPQARVIHIGLYRDERTLEPQEYYSNLPGDLSQEYVILTDPMLATGGSLIKATRLLLSHGVGNLRIVCLVAAPEGIERFSREYPHIPVYTATIDRELNSRGYILPGLGDAGDRIFNTFFPEGV